MDFLDVPAGSSDLAGFERRRTVVWGSEATRALGARFFPVLATGDWLRVEPDQLEDFLAECALLRSNLGVLAPSADPFKSHKEFVEQISQRLGNIEDAGERARQSGGGVVIW